MQSLHQLIDDKQWSTAIQALKDPDSLYAVSQPYDGDTALHRVCKYRAPDELILAVLNANEEAASIKGKDGNLPLHAATENNLGYDVVEALIRANPMALDCPNSRNSTPRDIGHKDPHAVQALSRPTGCWIQLIQDENHEEEQDKTVKQLRDDVDSSLRDLAESKNHYDELLERLEAAKKKVDKLGEMKLDVGDQLKHIGSELAEGSAKLDAKMTLMKNEIETEKIREKIAKRNVPAAQMELREVYQDLMKKAARLDEEVVTLKKNGGVTE